MVAPPDRDPTGKGPLLARALKALRRLRSRRTVEVAAALKLRTRTYEHFEGGYGPLNVERVLAFGEFLEVDPYSILAAIEICSPQFAVRTADNKLMTMFYLQLQEFDERTGDALALLDGYTLLAAFREMFGKLEADARRREALRSTRLPRPRPDEED